MKIYIFDADIVKIFVNDRFALATTVYSGNYSLSRKIIAFARGGVQNKLFAKFGLGWAEQG